jgi:hypothetical protein
MSIIVCAGARKTAWAARGGNTERTFTIIGPHVGAAVTGEKASALMAPEPVIPKDARPFAT